MADLGLIKKLREETGAGVMEAKKALEDSSSYEAAKELLIKEGFTKAEKKAGREAAQGSVFAYLHPNGSFASLAVVACETDFVARTEDFRKLGQEIAMQVGAMNPETADELLDQEYIRDPSRKVRDLLIELSAKVGERIVVRDFKRLEV